MRATQAFPVYVAQRNDLDLRQRHEPFEILQASFRTKPDKAKRNAIAGRYGAIRPRGSRWKN